MHQRLSLALSVLLALIPAAVPSAAVQPAGWQLAGRVLDASGAPVDGAVVTVEIGDTPAATVETAPDGRFTATGLPAGEARVTAAAPGFADAGQRVDPPGALETATVLIVLHPRPLVDTVTVTASRGTEPFETAAGTSIVTSAELLNAAAGSLDDALRNTPGFSLFRRSSSRVANPTTQGVTLRGVSGSGASRTLVLADGLPLNDPFGSWVYWNKIPQAAIDRVEIVRGATGDLYGADALGGVIQVLTFDPGRPRLRATADAASFGTARVSAFGGGGRQGWNTTAAGEWLDTDGVVIIAPDERGPVDTPANSRYRTGFGSLGYDSGPWRAIGRASGYREQRDNGTPFQTNETSWRQFSGEVAGTAGGAAWLARAAAGSQTYHQTFSAVAADRLSERQTNLQTTPSRFASAGGQYVRPWRAHVVLLGGEGRRTRSEVRETRVTLTGTPLPTEIVGGTEVSGALFGRVSLTASDRLTVVLGARSDFWSSSPQDPAVASHAVTFFSPRASLSWRLFPQVSMRAAVYRAFRTPTLNELHRGFRVGSVVTNPNPVLAPERLTGVEGGLLVSGARASARVVAFWNRLEDAIANITLSVTPALITRQRQNADAVRAGGLEVEADLRPHTSLTITGLAVVTASRFVDTPSQPDIRGNRIPQVPRYQLGAGATYAAPGVLTVSGQIRVLGGQYDDDRNELPLNGFTLVDAFASRTLGRGLHAVLSVENLFDREYDVGRTPVRSVGWPRTVRGGLRLFLP